MPETEIKPKLEQKCAEKTPINPPSLSEILSNRCKTSFSKIGPAISLGFKGFMLCLIWLSPVLGVIGVFFTAFQLRGLGQRQSININYPYSNNINSIIPSISYSTEQLNTFYHVVVELDFNNEYLDIVKEASNLVASVMDTISVAEFMNIMVQEMLETLDVQRAVNYPIDFQTSNLKSNLKSNSKSNIDLNINTENAIDYIRSRFGDFYYIGLWRYCKGINLIHEIPNTDRNGIMRYEIEKKITYCSKPKPSFHFNLIDVLLDEFEINDIKTRSQILKIASDFGYRHYDSKVRLFFDLIKGFDITGMILITISFIIEIAYFTEAVNRHWPKEILLSMRLISIFGCCLLGVGACLNLALIDRVRDEYVELGIVHITSNMSTLTMLLLLLSTICLFAAGVISRIVLLFIEI